MINSVKGNLSGFKRSPYGEEHYDSILERDYMYILENKPGIKKWTKKHGIKISYTFLGFKRNYLPDFLIELNDGSKEIHETKGLPFLLWLSVKIKRESAERWCRNYGYKYKFITRSQVPFYNPEIIREYEGSDRLQ